jgi:hypothetical protein
VDARRSNTDCAERSIDINIRVGAYLQAPAPLST